MNPLPITGPPPEQTHLKQPEYRADIDGLRAIAILSVIGYHAFPLWVKGGFIGVDVFFVISGFLISTIIFSSLERDCFSFVEFYSRRIRRIFPALLLVLIASLTCGRIALLTDEYQQLGKHIAGGAGFVSNFVLWDESGYFDNNADTKPLLHLWSLAIEEQFYIIWPLLLAFVWRKSWSFLRVTATIAVVSFIAHVYMTGGNPTAGFYSPISRFWELMAGGLLAYIALHNPELNRKYKNFQSVIGLILLTLGLGLINKESSYPSGWALLPTLGSFFIISAGPNAWLNSKFLSNKLLVWLGLISYPLYLFHWPLLSYARIIETGTPTRTARIMLVAISIALAWLTFKLIEKPIRHGALKTSRIYPLALLMTLIGLIGYTNYKTSSIVPLQIESRLESIKQEEPKSMVVDAKPETEIGSAPIPANEIEKKFNSMYLYDKILSQEPNYIGKMGQDRSNAIRAPFCHFNKDGQSFEEYELGIHKCLEIDKAKKNILIIGDSHAADLYVALSETHKVR